MSAISHPSPFADASLLLRVDCSQEYGPDQYFAHGEAQVVRADWGTYREAEPKPLARFGYRFRIEKIGRPHLLVLRCPDDKRRFMIINDGTTYDLSTGLITGHAFPLSGQMCEIRQVFWPRWHDCSVCFATWGFGEPAAASEFAVYELPAGLPPLDLSTNSPEYRELGIQYEDPCGTGLSEGATTFDTWLDHLVDYAKFTGANTVSYALCWYHGPLFPCRGERADAFSLVAGPDRKQYIAWTDEPPDWPAVLLSRFDQEGLRFEGVLTLLRLSSLMEKANTDLPAIQNGAETINNMLWNDQVQAGAMDWTCVYNTLNYPELLKRPDPLDANADFPFAYGEKTRQQLDPALRYHTGPIFNPVHPVVQKAIGDFISELAGRYGKFRSFQGVAFTLWAPSMVWFGSLHAGYDDYTVALFEKETGIRVPGDPRAADRFSTRYEFLTVNARQAWINWRCRKVRDFVCILRDTLTEIRSDLKLTLNLWSEAFVPGILGSGGIEHQIGHRADTAELYREAGLDVTLLRGERNIHLDLEFDGGGRDRSPSGYAQNAPLENFFMYRDHDFLDAGTLAAVAAHPRPGAFIFNAWHEAWGKHHWFPCEKDDLNLAAVAQVYGQNTPNLFRINSQYPPDGFWWNSQLRISPAFPPAPHFLEQYAHALAELDALRITRGGLFLDKCHSEELRDFARAFRSLPAVKFDTVGSSTDPVAVRIHRSDDQGYLYLVNREYYPIQVKVSFSPALTSVRDVAAGEFPDSGPDLVVELPPYQLRTLIFDSRTEVREFAVVCPAEIKAFYGSAGRQALEAITKTDQVHGMAGLAAWATGIERALREERWAWLRHALTSYPIGKCREIAGLPPLVLPSWRQEVPR